MRDKIYLRVGRTKRGNYLYRIDKNKNLFSLKMPEGVSLPTICIGLNLEIPDNFFKEPLADMELKINNPEIASQIKVEEETPNLEEVEKE